jgi:hypothetical protein
MTDCKGTFVMLLRILQVEHCGVAIMLQTCILEMPGCTDTRDVCRYEYRRQSLISDSFMGLEMFYLLLHTFNFSPKHNILTLY